MKTEHEQLSSVACEHAALEARFGYKVTTHLSRSSEALPHDIQERLRIAREQAVARASLKVRAAQKAHQPAQATSTVGLAGAAALLGRGWSSWWVKLGALAPLAVLVAGMLMVEEWQHQEMIEAAAEVDAAILMDALPPDAYTDPGFVEFLKEQQTPGLE